MELIVITQEKIEHKECEIITEMFSLGLQRLHLRKPYASKEELVEWIKSIPEQYHNRIVIHDHFSLVEEFKLSGVHLNKRNPSAPCKTGLSISRSCHSLEEIQEWKDKCDYLTLSPIYDSISKDGYCSSFTEKELRESGLINKKIYALGGIKSDRIERLNSIGFGGIVVLGYIWENSKPVSKYKELLEICTTIQNQDRIL